MKSTDLRLRSEICIDWRADGPLPPPHPPDYTTVLFPPRISGLPRGDKTSNDGKNLAVCCSLSASPDIPQCCSLSLPP